MNTPYEKAKTRDVEVEVQSFFVPEHSCSVSGRFFFSYHIRIRNSGKRPIQLLSRHWIITDGNGRIEEVRGPGVIGQQPNISPGEEFEYESFCPLPTPTGMMRGSYQVRIQNEADSEMVDVEIPQFFLVEPNSFH